MESDSSGDYIQRHNDRMATDSMAEPSASVRSALNNFFSAAERRAFITARVATGNNEDALDLVQESMMQLVAKYADRSHGEWGALFHTILQSRIRDWYRRQKVRNRWRIWLRQKENVKEDPIQTVADTRAIEPVRELTNRHQISIIEEALHRLPLRQRQAFMLRLWEGFDVAHTAKVMGCSQGSVKTHLSRALKAIRERLEEYGHDQR